MSTTAALPPPAPVTVTVPTTEEIAVYAYGLFEARGCEHGHDVEDWLEAEHVLLTERAARLENAVPPQEENTKTGVETS
jgi:hypothetical protein